MELSDYTAVETLRNGQPLVIRALTRGDRPALLAAIGRASDTSRYRRFFTSKRGFTDQEIEFYLNVDFVKHVAFVALVDKGGQPTLVGGARFIVAAPGEAELAFVVDDAYQGLGIGTALLRHLAIAGRTLGVATFVAEVLPDNVSMLRVFQASELAPSISSGDGVLHVTLHVR